MVAPAKWVCMRHMVLDVALWRRWDCPPTSQPLWAPAAAFVTSPATWFGFGFASALCYRPKLWNLLLYHLRHIRSRGGFGYACSTVIIRSVEGAFVVRVGNDSYQGCAWGLRFRRRAWALGLLQPYRMEQLVAAGRRIHIHIFGSDFVFIHGAEGRSRPRGRALVVSLGVLRLGIDAKRYSKKSAGGARAMYM